MPRNLFPPHGSVCFPYPSPRVRPEAARSQRTQHPVCFSSCCLDTFAGSLSWHAARHGTLAARGPKRHASLASCSCTRPATARSRRDSFSPAGHTRSTRATPCPAFSRRAGTFAFLVLVLAHGLKRHARCARPDTERSLCASLSRPRGDLPAGLHTLHFFAAWILVRPFIAAHGPKRHAGSASHSPRAAT